ncbi:mechanosensitive ion channel family protein [Roseateles albus]|uniref:Small-conductance mechanosensitive channel n=1 Tax=Roseateles albus TaxID=2987525 RepID=A0ABT5KJ96_9BURK|nr:mechanosensitive ion channel domain-containing protein [Roseateles albus]MDC8773010.1 mechanosensitive ion channel [Roseateles albus]
MKFRGVAWLLAVATSLTVLQPAAAITATVASPPPSAESADLRYINRVVYTMRVSVAGASPKQRAERALRRLQALPIEALSQPIERVDIGHSNERAVALRLGKETLLTVFPRDLDPDTGATVDDMATASISALEEAFAARLALHEPERVATGLAIAAIGIPVVVLVAWLAWRLRAALTRRLQRVVQAEAATHRIFGIDWSEFGLRAVAAVTNMLGFVAVAFLTFAWAAHALRQFPATMPLALEMRQFFLVNANDLTFALLGVLPNIAAICLVIVIARGVVWMVDHVFVGVGSGRINIPGVHRETARATRRLVVFVVWGLALTAAYPYIPGSDSMVFRGLSVFLGAMFTLGSSGVVSQWMHGLVIVYARALRAGDFVRCGEHAGVVLELGSLSVKIIDSRGDEVTLPNGTVVQGAIINHSRHAPGGAVRGSVRLSLGYDVPWAQVHALLKSAAERTDGVRSAAAPRVLERALGDFGIEYELLVEIAGARQRSATLAALTRAIRDVFDEAGVAILSPHFVSYLNVPAAMPLVEKTFEVADLQANVDARGGHR